MMKIRENNDMTDCIGVVYAKTQTQLSGPIKPGAVCYENKTEQWHDRLYSCNLHQKNEIELSWPIRLGVVFDKNETRQWPDWSYRFGLL